MWRVAEIRVARALAVALGLGVLPGACGAAPRPLAATAPKGSASTPAPELTRSVSTGAPSEAPTASAEPPSPRPVDAPAAGRDVDAARLAALRVDAERNDSASLVVVQRGRVLLDWSRRTPPALLETMSITKSVTALAVGILVTRGTLELDAPVVRWLPEWRDPRAGRATLRHFLTHTSGLAAELTTAPIYAAEDVVAEALSRPLVAEPGARFAYSNRGANLVAAIVSRAAREPLDRFVAREIFAPLGIARFMWKRDAKGQAHGFAGLALDAPGLARIGELVLAQGRHQGHELVGASFVHQATAVESAARPPDKRIGLSFWLVPRASRGEFDELQLAAWRDADVAPSTLTSVAPLVGSVYTSREAFRRKLRERLDAPALKALDRALAGAGIAAARWSFDAPIGWYSAGTAGQWLVVLPEAGIVAVRQRRSPRDPRAKADELATFPDFIERVRGLTEPPT